jgi:molybdopterin-binding protein
MHYYIAQQLIATDAVSFASEAGKQLLQAASLFELIATNLENKKWERTWTKRMVPLPSTLNINICRGLSIYCRARAQTTALVKAIAENKVSSTVKLRLALGTSSISHQAIQQLLHGLTACLQAAHTWLPAALIPMIAADRECAKAIGHFYFANYCAMDDLPGGKQVGQALALANLTILLISEQKLSGQYDPLQPGLPRDNYQPYHALAHLIDISSYLQSEMKAVMSDWDRENRLIYFQSLPKSTEEYTVPFPSEAVVATVPAPKEPEPRIIPFIDPPKSAGFIQSIFSGLSFSSMSKKAAEPTTEGTEDAKAADPTTPNSTTASSATASEGMTDEQFARELQRRLNASSTTTVISNTAVSSPATTSASFK